MTTPNPITPAPRSTVVAFALGYEHNGRRGAFFQVHDPDLGAVAYFADPVPVDPVGGVAWVGRVSFPIVARDAVATPDDALGVHLANRDRLAVNLAAEGVGLPAEGDA